MIRAGIIGGAGYAAGELIRLLLHHPDIKIEFVQSKSQAGKAVSAIHQDLVGETDLIFISDDSAEGEVIFLCSGHGRSRSWMEEHAPPEEVLVIDLSQDHRLDPSWVYGLPELQREQIRHSRRIANPGCFATAIQLVLLPLAAAGLLQYDVHVNAITGATGAGQKLQATSHFAWRQNNVSVYKAFQHQHLAEIGQSLTSLQANWASAIHFVPVRGGFTRGIFASMYTATELSEQEARKLYRNYYMDAVFTHKLDENPHLKQVVNTNKGLVYPSVIDGRLFVVSVIDNLLKGAAGQAVQNMNLAFGLPETQGLQLKASLF